MPIQLISLTVILSLFRVIIYWVRLKADSSQECVLVGRIVLTIMSPGNNTIVFIYICFVEKKINSSFTRSMAQYSNNK